MIVPKHYENLSILHENTKPGRAYYIPASKRMDDLVLHREKSDRMQLLNGIWKFKYYESIYSLKDEFYIPGYDKGDFDEIKVPAVWQNYGYDNHQYTNIRYPFPFDPPYVPNDNPCGAYVTEFEYSKDDNAPKAYLNFEGVDSCFYVWLNGEYVGYSQVTHLTSEFDISSLLKEGKNTLAVLVLKWCDGSYLEDQDKFRMSGIIRDVYILKRPLQAIWDYRVITEMKDGLATLKLNLEYMDSFEGAETQITLEDKEGNVVAAGKTDKSGEISFGVENVVMWNTEDPYLYTLILSTDYETIVEYVGFRTIEIKNSILYVNGQNIKFRGVNRHESDPKTGSAISIDQLIYDLKMMKEYNVNAIRTSHYTNVPYFYQLCDRFGFMVIDEADIEAHGPFLIYMKEDNVWNRFNRWNEKPADDPLWEDSIVDRVLGMVIRDKNRPCVIIWSMGNETAYGCNFEKALKLTKEADPTRITQYEGFQYTNPNKSYTYEHLDMYSKMYPSIEDIEKTISEDIKKPFLLVEYCHSMGNGPGDFEDYHSVIMNNDIMCGGFVWEWCDHAIYKGVADNGKEIYYYGGDSKETVHDGNFCMDGMVYPDRRPHVALHEFKNVYRPARVVSYDRGSSKLVLHNYMDFDNLKDYIDATYEVAVDGDIYEKGGIAIPDIGPHSEGETELGFYVPANGKVFLKITYTLKNATELLPCGHCLGFDELMIENDNPLNLTASKLLKDLAAKGDIFVSEDDTKIIVSGNRFKYECSKKNGMFDSVMFAEKEYLDRPMEINIWRAPTDNDMHIKNEWKKAHYNESYVRAYETEVSKEKDYVCIDVKAAVVADTIQKIMDISMKWKIDCEGKIYSLIEVAKDEEFPTLPRFGLRLFMNKEFSDVTYFGMGPNESYRDKHRSSFHGLFEAKAEELHEDYVRPQENGSHYDCDYVILGGNGYEMAAASANAFSFNVSRYTQEELERAAHNYELEECGSTVVCLDYAQNGIGSNSCGPGVLPQYRFDENKFDFDMVLVPAVK